MFSLFPTYDELKFLVGHFAIWVELCFEADDVLLGCHRENFRFELTLGLSNLKDQFFVAVVKFEAVYAAS